MKKIKVISGRAVRELVTLEDLIEPMRAALISFSTGTAYQHPRVTVEPSDSNLVLIMPAGSADTLGIKILTMYPRSGERNLPGVQGLIVLVDGTYGEPLAVVDGTVITELRTAAVSALATDTLARPDAETLAVLGAGVQARAHLAALRGIRPWTAIRLHSRTADKADALAKWAESEGLPCSVVGSPDEAVDGADVICTATSACQPLFAAGRVADSGVHVTAVGAFGATCRELPTDVITRAELFADSRDSITREAGDILIPVTEGHLSEPYTLTEIGEVLAGTHPGRTSPSQTTVFKSLGLPIEDVIASDLVYRRALTTNAGQDVDFD